MITPGILNIIALIYGFLCLKTIYEVWQARQTLFVAPMTPDKARLARSMAFFFFWPPAVLLHEGGHALLAVLFGAHGIRLHFFFYWGEISYESGLVDRQDWWIALAGNAVTYALGLGLLPLARAKRVPLLWRIVAFSVASNQLFVVLLWYPGLCLTHMFQGDFNVIYGKEYWWAGSVIVAAVNALTLAGYVWTNYTEGGKLWLARFLWQAAPPTAPTGDADGKAL